MSIASSRSTIAKQACTMLWKTGAALLLLLFIASPRLAAQTSSAGVVLGTVTDASNAVVPGVDVQLTNLATNISFHQITNAKGEYLFPQVAPGAYTLTFKADRFRSVSVQNVAVEVNKSFTANMQMQVGEVNQTVEVRSTAQAELQTTDAQVGDVIDDLEIQHLPTLARNALELRNLQPATTPENAGQRDSGGTVAGARGDQNTVTLDGIDVSDSIIGGQGAPGMIEGQPASTENVDEFRTGVTNANATFGRSSGGETTLVSRSGSNAFHGDAYWYTQNSDFNANTWDNNRLGIPRPGLRNNRGGVSIGGPIIKDRTFFFSNYEIHRFPNNVTFLDTVPTSSLANGTLTFNDAAGNPIQYNLLTSTACGSSGNLPCDPRSLGISPTVKALWALLPVGGNTVGGDGLNTTGYGGSVAEPTKDDDVSFRLDHNFTDKLHFFGRYFYDRELVPAGQLDIENGHPTAVGGAPDRNDAAVGGLDYQISANMTNEFRFAWIRSRADVIGESGEASAAALALSGSATSSNALLAALQPATTFLNVPIDNSVGGSRTQLLNGTTKEIVDNFFWTKSSHTIVVGTDSRRLPFLLSHTDHNIATTSPTAIMDSTSLTGSLAVPTSDTPPICSASLTTNCILPGDVSRWDSLYLGALGIINNVNLVGTRDGNLQPLPLLSNINSDTTNGAYNFYAQDTWRTTRTLTLTYGLSYGWQSPPHEANGLQSLLANNDNGNTIILANDYINAKASAAEQGNAFNPTLSFVPIHDSGRSTLYNTDWNDWAPRVSAAWNPSYGSGLLGRLLGQGKTVFRGGFGIAYDRTNIVSNVLSSLLGVGFSDVFTSSGPLCNASGTPGAGCPATPQAGADPGLNGFRVGQDGAIPLPAVTALTSPIIPTQFNALTGASGTAEVDAIGVDPNFKIGRSYMLDFTIQRELPANMLLETGYIGRLGRDLPSAIDLDASPYFVKDPTSGQTFAQAFDNVGCALRGSAGQQITPSFTCPATAQDQPFFENQVPGICAALCGALHLPTTDSSTQVMEALAGGNLIDGDAFTTFLIMDSYRSLIGMPSYNNLQVYAADLLESSKGISNYNAWFVTLHKRASRGLQFSINYTLSKSLDEQGQVENNIARFSTAFNEKLQYGPSIFDHRNVVNALYNYQLPFGADKRFSFHNGVANKFISGWYTAGIFTASSGVPVYPTQNGNYGEGLSANSGAVALIRTASLTTGVHSGVAGSGGIGTSASGLNLFASPQQAAADFRVPLLSVDGRTGESNPIYGLGFWNFDIQVGKETPIAEGIKLGFSADAFNLFNNVNFANPSLDLTNPATFGVITSTQLFNNRTTSARYLQLGLRIEF